MEMMPIAPFLAPLSALMVIAMPVLTENEKFVASNIDVRTVLGFAVAPAAVRKLLPEGWEPDVATAGPGKDINLRVTFIDTLVTANAEGRLLTPPRIAHLSVPARRTGAPVRGTMLLAVYSTGGNGGPYGNSVQATAGVERTLRFESPARAVVEELWQFHAQQGDLVEARVEYQRGGPAMVKAEDRIHSAARPGYYRIYRTEQAVDTIRNPEVDRVRGITFRASGPTLSPLFDGTERLISVVSVPWYARQVYVP